MSDAANKIAFQGVPGAYSHMACQAVKPGMEPVACASFEDMLTEVQDGRASLAMVPVENSIAGRVADIHHLLPSSGLYIIGEHFHRVNHHIMAPHGATLDQLTHVHSHAQGLAQCRNRVRALGLTPVMHPDTAGAAKDVAAAGDPKTGAIASRLAAEIYGLDILFESAEDDEHNTTRFLLMSATSSVRTSPISRSYWRPQPSSGRFRSTRQCCGERCRSRLPRCWCSPCWCKARSPALRAVCSLG